MSNLNRRRRNALSSIVVLFGLTMMTNACQLGSSSNCDFELVQTDGDCQRLVCGENGLVVFAPDDEDIPPDTECASFSCRDGARIMQMQTPGTLVTREPLEDCQRIECDGLGQTRIVPDDTDWTGTLNACIVGGCQNGALALAPKGTIVEDTKGDCIISVCDGQGNIVIENSEFDVIADMNPCTNDVCKDGVADHSFLPAGTVLESTPGDCKATQCDGVGGTVTVVDDGDVPGEDGITCSTASCSGGAPTHVAVPPGTACGGDGFVCHADLRCDACPDPGPGCPNDTIGESNDTQGMAKDFGTLNDPDSNTQSFCAVLGGPTDVDWYTYLGHDTLSGLVNPYQYFSNGTKARVCAYFKCNSQNTFLTCPANTQPDTAPGGQQGCCGTEPFKVDELGCDGAFNDDARVWIRVDNPEQSACVPYFLRFNY